MSDIADTTDPVTRAATRDFMEVSLIDDKVVENLIERLTDHAVVHLVRGFASLFFPLTSS